MYPWLIAPIAAKIEKRRVACLGEITRAPTAVSQGVAASFAPRFQAMKKERDKPTTNRTEPMSTLSVLDEVES